MKPSAIKHILGAAAVALATAGLAGCGQEPAQGSQTAHKADAHASAGAAARFSADGWKAGDRASWEDQLRARTQTQNEYIRFGN